MSSEPPLVIDAAELAGRHGPHEIARRRRTQEGVEDTFVDRSPELDEATIGGGVVWRNRFDRGTGTIQVAPELDRALAVC